MINAVENLAFLAANLGKVAEVGTVVALMFILTYFFPVLHHFGPPLIFVEPLHFLLHFLSRIFLMLQ